MPHAHANVEDSAEEKVERKAQGAGFLLFMLGICSFLNLQFAALSFQFRIPFAFVVVDLLAAVGRTQPNLRGVEAWAGVVLFFGLLLVATLYVVRTRAWAFNLAVLLLALDLFLWLALGYGILSFGTIVHLVVIIYLVSSRRAVGKCKKGQAGLAPISRTPDQGRF